MAAAEPQLEDKEENQRRGSSMAGGMAPLQAPGPKEDRPVGPWFWLGGQDPQEVGQDTPTSERAWGKVPTIELPPLETDEEMAE